jgi:hypothetical protein
MIPIMMYTSQEGELYVGQARALGAMGVLPKQVRPVDVSKVLYELHLLPDRRDMTEPVLAPVEMEGGAPLDRASVAAIAGVSAAAAPSSSSVATHGATNVAANGASNAPTNIDWARRIESAVKDQTVDIRRFIVACLDSFATRIVSDVRDARPASPVEPLPAPPPRAPRAVWPWGAAIAAASLVALAFAASWLTARNELAQSRAEIAGLTSANVELQRARNDLTATVKDLTADLAVATGGSAAPAAATSATAGASTVASHVESVPYGEIPFDRSRLDVLRDLLAKLEAQGFHGVVKITSLAGLFCLSGNAADGYTLAAAAVPAAKCDLVGNPFEESLSGQQRQSLAFANLIAGVRQRTAGAITVAIESGGSGRAITPYPAKSDLLTAGEWNRAAAANNRVEFIAESSGQ